MQMFCIFSKDLLKRIAKNELDKENLSISQIYMQLMSDKKYTLEASIQERSEPLFKKYGNKNNKDDENEGDTMPNTPTPKNPPLNQILYGPPGTGKTYSTIDMVLEILDVETLGKSRAELKAQFDEFRQNGQIEFVTFHQSFSYEEFVEGIKPVVNSLQNMTYKVQNGIFKESCERALENSQKPYILIIDEINRGNISKILGELITLIEPSKRIGASNEEKARGIGNESLKVTLPYSNETFGVPSNLYIIGTMNTADRSIALLDTALRRRFEFVEMMPDCEHKEISTDCESVNLRKLLKAMNERIEFLLDREHTIGHSFFIKVNSLSELQQVFKNKIIPLLQEYFYDDYKKIQAVLNDNQMIKPKPKPNFLGKFNDEVDSEKVVYEIADSHLWNSQTFITIYQSKDSNESNDNE